MQQGMVPTITRLVEAMRLALKKNTQNNVPLAFTSNECDN
jgi:hypothetical protein